VNAPNTVSSFMQRMGRTGRRSGAIANTTFFIEKEEFFLKAVAIVELARSHWVEDVRTDTSAWHILLHQIMALCLERGGIARSLPWKILGKAYCFSGIDEMAFSGFIDFLLAREFLHDDGGMLSMGLEAEKAFGRKNFMELYSVFTSPTEFEVTGISGDVIGSVEWDFLEKLLEDNGAFFLAGKAWSIDRIEWKKKTVFVVSAPAGKVPKWGGINPSFSGYDLTRKKRDILVSDDEYSYLAADAKAWLAALRADRKSLLLSGFAPSQHDERGIIWWTYAGGYVNNTLRFALKLELNTELQSTDDSLRILDGSISEAMFSQAVDRISAAGYWDDVDRLTRIASILPDYRLSKFQPYLPAARQTALVASTILDIPGVIRFLDDCQKSPD